MTLTFKTAKHAVDKYGKIFNIVDDADPLSAYSVNREQAIESNKLEYPFTPCIVVTAAREALEAAWELAYEPEDGIIPANAWHIRRSRSDGEFLLAYLGPAVDADGIFAERRLLDPPEPEPEPEPEPWEESDYCYAAGMFFERGEEEDGPYWVGGDCCPQRYEREDMAKLNPKPVTIEGESE